MTRFLLRGVSARARASVVLRCAAVLLVLSAGCEFVRSPVAPDLVETLAVHSLIQADDTVVFVLVSRIGAHDARALSAPVTDADVRLVSGADTVLLATQHEESCFAERSYDVDTDLLDTGCYSARVAGGLRAGNTYELLIDAGALGRAYGRTVLPMPPVITAPSAGTSIVSGSDLVLTGPPVTVRWTGVPADGSVQLRVRPATPCEANFSPVGVFGYASYAGWITVLEADSLLARLYDDCDHTGGPISAQLRVVALDTAFTRYVTSLRAADSRRAVIPAANLSGATGVFGASARSTLPVLLTRE